MQSKAVREEFLKFFEKKGHTRVKSSSLIPAADPTLLFTNAGMVQFKDCFLGLHDPGYKRATTSQKCVRAGGKHNDLENVGFTPRHHTFFEMLGNFSFGDYFKKDAIAYAWEFLTVNLKLPQEKLWITVFETDDEAAKIWESVGVPANRIFRLGEKDNFWAMGDTGPCGPCTEIYYDWGPEYSKGINNPNPGNADLRFLEIWNLVFMQFNRDSTGKMTPLPKPSVDTGAGLERVSAVLQGKYSNYDGDLFSDLISAISKFVGKPYEKEKDLGVSMRVIADHMRSGSFLLSDGVIPSNEGRGYVLRRILRRAIRHGKKLGQDKPFLFKLVGAVVEKMSDVYPELRENQRMIETLLREEEERFHETLHRGLGLLEESIDKTKKAGKKVLPGDVAFKLYDTFGFPSDLIDVICTEHGLSVDHHGFDQFMERQRSQSAWVGASDAVVMENLNKGLEKNRVTTEFLGYTGTRQNEPVALLFNEQGEPATALITPAAGYAVFKRTPFYAESGGQVGDKGSLRGEKERAEAEVETTFKIGSTFLHKIRVKSGQFKVGQGCYLEVDEDLRKRTAINHTATHMLHAALRSTLGDRVKQAGSLVDPTRLRFDFTFPRGVTAEERTKIEEIINKEIAAGRSVEHREMPYDEAIKSGAMAFFDEKYGDRVRVISMSGSDKPFSVELCGGTHLNNSAEIGVFKILSESSVASGVRRIEAVTSQGAIAYLNQRDATLSGLEAKLNTRFDGLDKKIDSLQDNLKSLQKENEQLRLKVAQGGSGGGGGGGALWDKKETFGSLQAVMSEVPDADMKVLRTLVDQVRDKLKERALVLLAANKDGKVTLCLGVTKDLVEKYSASKIIQPLAKEVGGTGGGRNDFAQAGGSDGAGIPKAFDAFRAWLKANT